MSPELQAIINMPMSELSAKSGEALLALVDEAEALMEQARVLREWLESAIACKYVYKATSLRGELQQEFGLVQFEDGQVKVTSEVPRAVTWDQKKLNAIARLIREQGEDPEELMEVQYSVSDARFDQWPEVIQNSFRPALTIRQGRPNYRLTFNNKEVKP